VKKGEECSNLEAYVLKRWMAGEDLEADLQGKGITNLPHIISVSFDAIRYTDKKENQIFLYGNSEWSDCKVIYEEMRKYSPYMRRPLVIYDFATAPS
jgi:hypothetical protein